MEADSTTFENNSKSSSDDISLPFNSKPANFKLYKEFIANNGEGRLESQLVSRMQSFGLIPKSVSCPEDKPTCKVVSKSARVIDRVQWVCEGCGKRQPVRSGSFFIKTQCSLIQALQVILAWCEDADITSTAQNFVSTAFGGLHQRVDSRTELRPPQYTRIVFTKTIYVKPRVAKSMYDKLDDLIINELKKSKLGGENIMVLSEMYPDCLNRLSPDTTDQPHVHRILMIADTNHIPTHYRLHVIKKDQKRISDINNDQSLKEEVEKTLASVTEPHCTIIMGNNMPSLENSVPLQQLLQHCDVDMQHFLSNRIWSQAITLCSASRDFCTETSANCAGAVQRYLDASLYRLRYGDGFYEHILQLIANDTTYTSPPT